MKSVLGLSLRLHHTQQTLCWIAVLLLNGTCIETSLASPPAVETEAGESNGTVLEEDYMPIVRRVPPLESSQVVKPKPDRATCHRDCINRSKNMDSMAIRAREHIRYAFQLAERGAVYSAEAHFFEALKLVAETLDADCGTDVHIQALVAGLLALEEADDFVRRGHDLITTSDVSGPIAAHRTPVLKGCEPREFTSRVAAQRYCEFAQEQLVRASEDEPVASRAMYGLARVHAHLVRERNMSRPFGNAKAAALHRAALTVDTRNYLAANELAVLLARHGQNDEALWLLQHSLSICPQPETCHNMSVVLGRQGATEREKEARRHYELLVAHRRAGTNAAHAPSEPGPIVRWVSHEEFTGLPAPPGLLSVSEPRHTPVPTTVINVNSAGDSHKRKISLPSWLSKALTGYVKDRSRRRSGKCKAASVKVNGPQQKPSQTANPIRRVSYPDVSDESEMGPIVQAAPLPETVDAPVLATPWRPGPECPRCGVHCNGRCDDPHWYVRRPIPWQLFAQGEYVGPSRLAHVPEYRLRVDDIIEFVYRLDGKPSSQPYKLEVGDQLRIASLVAEELNRDVIIQPDGQITLSVLGQVRAAGRTLDDLRSDLEKQYAAHVNRPNISITPLKVNSTAVELINTVDRRFGAGGQAQQVRVTPAGTVQLPAIGSAPAQGLTIDELKYELERRYARLVDGMEITPILVDRAPRFIYVVGEVAAPGRFVLEGPTTVIQAIALARSYNVGARISDIVVFRRDENWQLMATKLDLRHALLGKRPCPPDEIWLRDSDIVLVPKHPVLWFDDAIDLFFTRGLYGVVPLNYSIAFRKNSTI